MGAARRVAIVGAGVMGAEIAQAVAAARMNVVLVDANAEALPTAGRTSRRSARGG